AFEKWYADKFLLYIHPDALLLNLTAEFRAHVQADQPGCAVKLTAELYADVMALVVQNFLNSALHGWQFERFEAAWCEWLRANAQIDWGEERLQETLETILATNLVDGPNDQQKRADALCKCAAAILEQYGVDFYQWMDSNVKAGNAWGHFTEFKPRAVTLCAM